MLKLLGAPSIESSSGPIRGRAAQGRRLALLALLALARGRPVTRDKLLGLLWPESPADRARHQLSDAVYIVRSALGDDAIRSSGDELELNTGVITSDAGTFEQLLDDGRLEPAVELFTGPLLDGFHLSGAAEFERWLDAERVRLDHRYAAAVTSLAEASEKRGDFATAVGWWRRLSTHEPYSGRATLGLMRSLEVVGDRAGALQHARAHATLLRDEFDAEPDPEVEAFAERLRLEPTARAVPEPAVIPPPVAPRGPAPDIVATPAAPGQPPTRRVRAVSLALLVAVAALGVYGIRTARPVATPTPARSVGVLPFVNMSPEPENAYFSDGLSEQIIAALSRIEGLQVAARTSSFALRDRGLDVRSIGDTLGVAAVLEGSVRRDGPRLRVTAQLIDASSGYHLWSEEYDRELRDVFAVQEEIARAIASALELRLARAPSSRAQGVSNLEAYDLYLRGLFLRNTLSADGLRQAAAFFDRAIELDPDFALAYAAKASVVAPQIYFGYVPLEGGVRELRALTTRALELDPTLGEAHAALGILRLFFEWDWEGAERALRRAIELNPNDAHAHHHLANYMNAMGRITDAVPVRERAVALDPLNARSRYVLARMYGRAGDYERAISEYRRARQLDPVHPLALGRGPALPAGIGEIRLWQGRDADAVEELIEVAELREATKRELDAMRAAYATSGMPGFWRKWLEMDLRQSRGAPDPLRVAILWSLIGDTARTVHWLERAYDERNPGLIYIRGTYPTIEELRSHPRVARIFREMKLPAPETPAGAAGVSDGR